MVVQQLRQMLGEKPHQNDGDAVRERWPILIDLKDGDPPRRIESIEWDYEHKALILTVD